MRVIYCDEAGTSEREPFKVAVGVAIGSDEAWRAAYAALQAAILRHVPRRYRDGFIFHAKDIFGGTGIVDRAVWPLQERMAFFDEVVHIPRLLRLPVSVGAAAADDRVVPVGAKKAGFTASGWAHVMAVHAMLQAADRDIRKRGAGNEVAFTIFEQVPEKAKYLKAALRALQVTEYTVGREHMNWADTDHPENWRVTAKHLMDAIHFAEKTEAPLLQLADACAFTIRRALCKQSHADRLLDRMIGEPALPDYWAKPLSSVTFHAPA